MPKKSLNHLHASILRMFMKVPDWGLHFAERSLCGMAALSKLKVNRTEAQDSGSIYLNRFYSIDDCRTTRVNPRSLWNACRMPRQSIVRDRSLTDNFLAMSQSPEVKLIEYLFQRRAVWC